KQNNLVSDRTNDHRTVDQQRVAMTGNEEDGAGQPLPVDVQQLIAATTDKAPSVQPTEQQPSSGNQLGTSTRPTAKPEAIPKPDMVTEQVSDKKPEIAVTATSDDEPEKEAEPEAKPVPMPNSIVLEESV